MYVYCDQLQLKGLFWFIRASFIIPSQFLGVLSHSRVVVFFGLTWEFSWINASAVCCMWGFVYAISCLLVWLCIHHFMSFRVALSSKHPLKTYKLVLCNFYDDFNSFHFLDNNNHITYSVLHNIRQFIMDQLNSLLFIHSLRFHVSL